MGDVNKEDNEVNTIEPRKTKGAKQKTSLRVLTRKPTLFFLSRNTGIGVCSMMARCGSIITPFIVLLVCTFDTLISHAERTTINDYLLLNSCYVLSTESIFLQYHNIINPQPDNYGEEEFDRLGLQPWMSVCASDFPGLHTGRSELFCYYMLLGDLPTRKRSN